MGLLLFLPSHLVGESVRPILKLRSSSDLVLNAQSLSESIDKTITHFESVLFPSDEISIKIETPESITSKKTFTLQASSLGESLSIIAAHFNCSLVLDKDIVKIHPVKDSKLGFYLFEFHQPFRIGILKGDCGIDPIVFKNKIEVKGEKVIFQ